MSGGTLIQRTQNASNVGKEGHEGVIGEEVGAEKDGDIHPVEVIWEFS